MNFYKRYMGDIQRDTGHLSLAEFGAYDRLLDHYYATEQPLPGSMDACCRIARAMAKDERKAVESVLSQFFTLSDVGYTQGRTEKEIAEAQPKIAAAKTNGAKGGRPKKNLNETQEKPSGLLKHNPAITQVESSPEPDIKPSLIDTVSQVSANGDLCVSAGEVCKAMKALGIIDVNPSHPKLLALIKAGASQDEFINATSLSRVRKFNYILGTVEGMREQSANEVLTVGKTKPRGFGPSTDDQTITNKAKELNISLTGLSRFQAIAKVNTAMGVT